MIQIESKNQNSQWFKSQIWESEWWQHRGEVSDGVGSGVREPKIPQLLTQGQEMKNVPAQQEAVRGQHRGTADKAATWDARLVSWLLLLWPSSLLMAWEDQQRMVQVLRPVLSMSESWAKLLAPGFVFVYLEPLQASGEGTHEWMIFSLSLSLCSSNFQVELKKKRKSQWICSSSASLLFGAR